MKRFAHVRPRESDYRKGESYFMRKMAAFAAYHRQGRHTARYGMSNFRVITITPTRQRAENLCRKLAGAGLASGRFWFTDLAAVSSDESGGMLEKIFFTPRDIAAGVLHSFGD